MVSRTILVLFAVTLVAAFVSAAPAEEVKADSTEFGVSEVDEAIERGVKSWLKKQGKKAAKKIIKEIVAFFKKEAKKVNFDCVKEVYELCDINPLLHPKKYFKCGKNYVMEHKDHCYESKKKDEKTEEKEEKTEEKDDINEQIENLE